MMPHHFVSECDGNLFDTSAPLWSTRPPLRSPYMRTFPEIETGAQFRATLRAGPFAWPGGYTMALQTSDGAALCFDCGRAEARSIIRAIRDRSRDGWRVIGSKVHWEGPDEECAHCGRGIPSAYGELEGDEE